MTPSQRFATFYRIFLKIGLDTTIRHGYSLHNVVAARSLSGPHSGVNFGGLVGEAQEFNREQAALRAAKQEASRKFDEALREAQRLATVLRFAIKEHFGPDSEKLVEFGLQR